MRITNHCISDENKIKYILNDNRKPDMYFFIFETKTTEHKDTYS